MLALFIGVFTGLFLVALAAVIVSSFMFRNLPPLQRASVTAAIAWLICSVGIYFLPEQFPQQAPRELLPTALAYLPFAIVVWLLMWRAFRLYWVEDETVEEPDLPADADRWPTIHGGEDSYWPAEPAPEPHPNYVVRHWRGECSLPAAYWLNGGLIATAVVYLLVLALRALEDSGASLRSLATAALFFIATTILLWVWGSVGTWRSAQLHEDRGGSGNWAIAAQVMVVIGTLGMFLQIRSYVLQTHELGVLAMGGDPLGEAGTVTLIEDGTSILVEGNLTSGVSQRFRRAVANAERLRTVVLSSPGGRQLEAIRIAESIAERGLDTRVEEECLSACTLILVAGRDRSADVYAAIGFHQPSFPGLNASDLSSSMSRMRLDYRRAGVSADFVERALSTPSELMWVPSHEQLIAANVLTTTELVVSGPSAAGSGNGSMLED